MFLGGETHVSQDLCDDFVPVLRQSTQVVEVFVEDPEVVGTGVGITEGGGG